MTRKECHEDGHEDKEAQILWDGWIFNEKARTLPSQPKHSLRHDKEPNSESTTPVHYEPNETYTAIPRSSL